MTKRQPEPEGEFKVCVIRSEQRETELPKKAILKELRRCHFGSDELFGIKLALEEALTNAVRHGNQRDPTKTITVRYSITPERAIVIVRDEGPGFEPKDIPDPTTDDRLSVPSGRGIMLMRAYMDEVEYRDEGREVYFMKRRR